jgi:hypothetical protein
MAEDIPASEQEQSILNQIATFFQAMVAHLQTQETQVIL